MTTPIRILVVEDDNDINALLCSIIRKSGYEPQAAYSGTEALLHLANGTWDMVLLDLMLPGMSGEDVMRRVREASHVPVLIISAKLDQRTKVDMLRTGADDYITKPFDIEEVSARIDSQLRRSRRTAEPSSSKELRHKDIVVDPEARTVSVGGQPITLTAREYSILLLFLSSPKKVFTKANVYRSAWGDEFHDDDNTINVHMSNLRNKLSRANPNEEYIETIWGMGYRLRT
ncbi:response regulator transcription factor [Paenibacillus sp. PR3]|uniref:Response regulator transcription factor n=1 Tax=Paenibacillus terricola TaxID=2763503 RepID=A0ABR8MWZ5_9BACL|nr:response regulator transcription factor [Paenibacillus terricola]MBD3920483.1 response regulator transcription factor [Paenibacillus terricola]